MHRWTVLPLLLAALFMVACSDDDNGNGKKDNGVTADQGVADQGPAGDDQGPAGDKGAGDGPVAQKVEDYMPKDDEVKGWNEDTSKGQAGVEAGYTKKEIEDIINGEHDPYAAEGCNGFALEHYKKSITGSCDGTLELKIWEMKDAAGAKKMHEENKKKYNWLNFEDMKNVTTAGVIADDAPGWRALAYKGSFVLKLWAKYSDQACMNDVKTETITWAETVTQKLP